jgi:hypothetical protein
MIKSHLQAALVQRAFRHVHVSSGIEIAIEFSFVGIEDAVKGRSERTAHSGVRVGRAIHPITPLDLGLFTVRRAAG